MDSIHHTNIADASESSPRSLYFVLIEDNEGDILLTREALDEAGVPYSLRVLRDGEKAMTFLTEIAGTSQKPFPDLVLLDINLPKLDGHELLRFIKQHERLKQIPVVMFTTSEAQKDIAKAYRNHANCYITKPAEAEDYMAVLKQTEYFWGAMCQLPHTRHRSS